MIRGTVFLLAIMSAQAIANTYWGFDLSRSDVEVSSEVSYDVTVEPVESFRVELEPTLDPESLLDFEDAEFCPGEICFEEEEKSLVDTGGPWGEEICLGPSFWQIPQIDKLHCEIRVGGWAYDGDFEVGKTDNSSASGDFDGPGWFDGVYSVNEAADGSIVFKLQADGSGHNVDIVIEIDCHGAASVTGKVDGKLVNVKTKVAGSGSSRDPFSLTFGKVTLRWSIDGGNF